MNCMQCELELKETQVQRHKRLMSNGPKICTDCNRINQAEIRAEKRLEIDNRSEHQVIYQKAFYLKKIYGKVSPALLIRKFKISSQEANYIAHQVNN